MKNTLIQSEDSCPKTEMLNQSTQPNCCIYIVPNPVDIEKNYIYQRSVCEEYIRQINGIIVSEVQERNNPQKKDEMLFDAIERCRLRKRKLIIAEMGKYMHNKGFVSEIKRTFVDVHFCDFPQINKTNFAIFAEFAKYEDKFIDSSPVILPKEKFDDVVISKSRIQEKSSFAPIDVSIDKRKMNALLKETEKSKKILADIFTDDEETVLPDSKKNKLKEDNILKIIKLLMEKDFWKRTDVEKICKKYKMS
ncbi:MAG: hypothetical protein HUK08_07405, partial [Bacteroidaceae bacterium]|nr:hypothetical protein [Bacteroidaceae bacterium]